MAKDSYWFKHDSSAGRGTRMRKMAFIYGHWGKGIYWDVIEVLREQDGYCFDSDETSLQMMCELIGCKDTEKFINWFKDCIKINLFQTNENKFFNEVLIENMETWETKKTNGSKGGRPKKTESKPKVKANQKRIKTIREEKSTEDNINNKKEEFKNSLSPFLEKYGKDMLNEFYKYWTEPNKSNTKIRKDLEQTWDTDRRLETWARNDKNFGIKNKIPQDFVKTKTAFK